MSTRHVLHQLVDELPEEDVSTAERVLQVLRATPPAPYIPLETAPVDSEPDDDDFDGGLMEARADAEAGRVVSHEVAKRHQLRDTDEARSLAQMESRGLVVLPKRISRRAFQGPALPSRGSLASERVLQDRR